MDEIARQTIEINRVASSLLPTAAWASTVPIVSAIGETTQHLGTGTLFRIGDAGFLITAGHVFKKAAEFQATIGIGGTTHGRFVSLANGYTLVSTEGQYGCSFDPLDIGLHRLSSTVADQIPTHRFLRFDEVEFVAQPPGGVYTMVGFPTFWSTPSRSSDEKVSYRALEFTACRYDRDCSGLERYQERLHLLIDGRISQTTDSDAASVKFEDTHGWAIEFPFGIKGMSGCSVWRIGDLAVPIDEWKQTRARLVGVLTGSYQDKEVIQATRWVAVSTMIHQGFPELRPAMALLRPN